MADCCSTPETNTSAATKHPCPLDGKECAEVSARTIAYHLREVWKWTATAERYFFCADPACPVVYFGSDGSTITKNQLRTRVGLKDELDDALVCYCFGVTRADVRGDPGIRDFVVAQTKHKRCACDTCNPSGRCCLKDFPK